MDPSAKVGTGGFVNPSMEKSLVMGTAPLLYASTDSVYLSPGTRLPKWIVLNSLKQNCAIKKTYINYSAKVIFGSHFDATVAVAEKL